MVELGKGQHKEILSAIFVAPSLGLYPKDPPAKKFCVECGKQKLTAIFMNDPWCGENCRKSLQGEGPKVGLSNEWFEREKAKGNIIELPQGFREHFGLDKEYVKIEHPSDGRGSAGSD